MLDSKSEAVFLPLVGQNMQTTSTTSSISTSEGVDLLICDMSEENNTNNFLNSVLGDVKIPIFVSLPSMGNSDLLIQTSELMRAGAGGFVISLKDLGLYSDAIQSGLFNTASLSRNETINGLDSSNEFKLLEAEKDFHVTKRVAGFVNLEGREEQLIESEKSVLMEAVNLIQKAAPMVIF